MKEIIKKWLEEMYNNEIRDVKDTINNEELWELGSQTEESQELHKENIELLKEYLEKLKELRNQL